MPEKTVKDSIQLIHKTFTDLLNDKSETEKSHSIIVSSLIKPSQTKYYIFELKPKIIRLIQKDNKGLKREWEYAFNSTGDIFLNNVKVSTELSNEFSELLADVSLDINKNKVEVFKAESVNSIPKNSTGVISALSGRSDKFLHIKQLSKEELKQISGGVGGIAPVGLGVSPSLSPSMPVARSTRAASMDTMSILEQVMADLEPDARLIPTTNVEFLPVLSRNIETLVNFFRHTPDTLRADHDNWSRDIQVAAVPPSPAPEVAGGIVTGDEEVGSDLPHLASTTGFKELIRNYQKQKTDLKAILDEATSGDVHRDAGALQDRFESGLKKLIDAAETIQIKIDMWVDLKGLDKTDRNFEKLRNLQSHLSSDLKRLSVESKKLRNVVTVENQVIYERLEDLSLISASKVTNFNEAVGAERDVVATPDEPVTADALPKPKHVFEMEDTSRLETELNRFLAGGVGARETHEFNLSSAEYNQTDGTLTVTFNSVGGDARHKILVLPFKAMNHFESLEEAESILKKGSLGPSTEASASLGSNRLFSKLMSQAKEEIEAFPSFRHMSSAKKKQLLLGNFNRKYNTLIKSLKPIVTEQINKEAGVKETHDYEVMAAGGRKVNVVSHSGVMIGFTVKPTRRRMFSGEDLLKNHTFSPSKREDGTYHITAKNDDLLIKGLRSDGKKSIRKLQEPSHIAIDNKKMTSSMVLRTVTEIKDTIPKEMFDECLPKETSIYSKFKNKFFKKATRHADFYPTKTWTNMMKDDLNPMSPANKGIGGKVLWGLKAVAFPITMIVNGIATGMVHSKRNWFGIRSTTKKFNFAVSDM